jgi:hypothetical protein
MEKLIKPAVSLCGDINNDGVVDHKDLNTMRYITSTKFGLMNAGVLKNHVVILTEIKK